MAGALKRAAFILGLAEDDGYEYDEYDERDERAQEQQRPEPKENRAEVAQLHKVPAARVVREPAVSSLTKITTIHPRTYNEARAIGEAFRDGTPVIMNLSNMEEVDAKRLVDFAAGLAFGLHGSIERVTSKVFLLSPETVEVDGAPDEANPSHRGLFNQS